MINRRPRIIFMGYGKGLKLVCDVARNICDVAGVFTQDRDFYQKNANYFEDLKRFGLYEDIIDYCREYEVDCFRGKSVCEEKSIEWFQSKKPDLIVSHSLWEIVKEPFFSLFPDIYNLHGSDIPNLMGRAPQSWAILNGFEQIGYTIHRMIRAVDQGAIAKQVAVPVEKRDIPLTIINRQLAVLPQLFCTFISEYERCCIDYVSPNIKAGNYWPRLNTEIDGRIEWSLPTIKIDRILRAFNRPFPGAWCYRKDTKIRILDHVIFKPEFMSCRSGVVYRISDLGCYVTTGDGSVCILRVDIDGVEYSATETLKLGEILE